MTAIEYFNHGEIFRDSGACDVVSIPLGGGMRMLMLSGVAAENPDGTFGQANPAAADIAGQVAFVWARIGALLKAHDASLDNIVKVTFYTTDSRYLMDPIATSLGANFTGRTRPAATGVVVSGLAWPELLVEVDVTAIV